MGVSLGQNIAALLSQRYLQTASSRLSTTLERLSSGARINRASDDAAGLAIASSLNAYSRVSGQGIRNLNDGISALNIADGSLGELSNITSRLRELATQAANGSLSLTQRRALDGEADQLTQEFNRAISTVSFNGLGLLNRSMTGGFQLQGGWGSGAMLNFSINSSLSRSTGAGTFNSTTSTGGAVSQDDIETGDFNRDGHLDLLSIDSTATPISLQLGNGDGTFKSVTTFGSSTVSGMAVGDFDRNGTLDVVAGASSGGSLTMFSGDGQGGFTVVAQSVGTASSIDSAGDLNGDGILDLVGYLGTTVYIYSGTSTGGFTLANSYSVGASVVDTKIADMNNDGRAEVLTQTSTAVKTAINAGNFQFNLQSTSIASVTGQTIDTGDINGDGFLDVVFGSSILSPGFIPLLGNGDGTYSQGTTYSAGSQPRGVKLVDFNGDGFLDILNSANSAIWMRVGNGDGTFGAATSVTGFSTQQRLCVGDFNEDGATDFAVTCFSSSVRVGLANAAQLTTLQNLNLNSQSSALSTLTVIDDTLNRILKERGDIGANLRRLESALSNLGSAKENVEAAASRIQDVDVASETASMMRNQILQQSSSSILAQANSQPGLALFLLQGI